MQDMCTGFSLAPLTFSSQLAPLTFSSQFQAKVSLRETFA